MMNEQGKRFKRLGKQMLCDGDAVPCGELWQRVVAVAQEAHADQFRNNGRPYLAHVLDVAEVLAAWGVQPLVVMAGVLHDAVRYGRFASLDEVTSRLAHEGLSGLLDVAMRLGAQDSFVDYVRDDRRLEKMFVLMEEDLRALLVRCANRLANLRDLDAFKGPQRDNLLLSTDELFLPLLDRLGMWEVRVEVENLLFEVRTPERYRLITHWQAQQRSKRAEEIEAWRVRVEEALAKHGLQDAIVEISYRSPASTFRRHMADLPRHSDVARNVDELSQLDARHLFVTTVLLSRVDEAYLALADIHQCGTPSMASFRDYFAQPKAHGYAALHTTVVVNSEPWRLHLRTHTLHALAKQGILLPAAYDCWHSGQPPQSWQAAEQRALRHFINSLHNRKPDRLAVLTPKGEVIELRQGATVLDFAYGIHTDVGRQTGIAFVNEVQVPLNSELHSGDVVEIRKDLDRQWPNPQWLDWVRSSKARNAIQMQLRQRPQIKGRSLIDQALRQQRYKLEGYENRLSTLAAEMGRTPKEIFIGVAEGSLSADEIVKRLLYMNTPQRKTFYRVQLTPESVARFPLWHNDMIVSVDCCVPPPGTPIVGYHSQQGIELHRADCANLIDSTRKVELCWQAERVEAKLVKLTLRAVNRRGLIHDLTYVLQQANVEIVYLEGKRLGEMDEINVTLEVTNELELGYLLNTLRGLKNVNRMLVDGKEADAASEALQPYLAPPQPIISPFSPGRPVTGKGYFWGRTTEVMRIETLLSAKTPTSLLVQGARRIGKTSLLKQIQESRTIRHSYRYVYVDLQSVAYSSVASVLRLIARHLARSSRRMQPSGKWARHTPAPTLAELNEAPQETFLSYLAELTDTSRYMQKRILLALDEFGTLVESVRANALDPRIFHLLRSVMQHNPLVTLMLCTSDDLAELLAEEGVLELLNVTTSVRLSHLDRLSAQQLIQEPLRGQVYFEPDAISSLLRITDKHPYYLQILGSNLITQLNQEQRRNAYQSDIQRLVRDQINLHGSEFMHLWSRTNPTQHAVLQALCAPPAASMMSPFDASIIQRRLQEAKQPLSLEQITETLERLTNIDTLTRIPQPDGNTRYHVRVELFRDWFAAHHALLAKEN